MLGGWLLSVALVVAACGTAAGPPSSEAISWSRVPHDEAIFGGAGVQRMASVTAGGPGLVAVGSVGPVDDADAAVWTSLDGLNWSRVTHDEAALGGERSQRMTSVTVGGPGLVAVGWDRSGGDQDAAVWTSPDGIAWFRIPHDEAALGGEGSQRLASVTSGGPGLVAVGSDRSGGDVDAAVWTSPVGIVWSRVPHSEAVFGGEDSQDMRGVTAGGEELVAVGSDRSGGDQDAAVWTSPDGITWSRVPHDEAVFGGEGFEFIVSVTSGGPGLVAVGRDGLGDADAAVWTSPDGLTWSRVPHDEAVFGGVGRHGMRSVTAGGPGLVAVGEEGSRGAVWVMARED
ncbi:MAG: hypothetical protein ACE5MI_09665 [Acidimicrobiia bacterium]